MPYSYGMPGPGRPRNPRMQPKGVCWEETRQLVFSTYGTVCHWCHHPGAFEIDHLVKATDLDSVHGHSR